MKPLYTEGSLCDIPLAVVLGSDGDGGVPKWQELFAQQAVLSTNQMVVMIEGANHVSLVDRQDHALQTGAVILKIVKAVRLNESSQ